jgi:glycosyltransferase involved in cell wall biosynthesis
MRILFVNEGAYLPQLFGGVETTTFDLSRQLARMGHQSAVMCGIGKRDTIWLRNRIVGRLTGRQFPSERYRGTLVYRGYHHSRGLPEVVNDFAPDALVIASGSEESLELVAQCADTGIPSFYYFHNLALVRRLGDGRRLSGLTFLANSKYTAEKVKDLLDVDAAVVPPFVDAAAYRTTTSRRHVTMVNPRKVKGGHTALDIAAACPDIPFVFVEAWGTGDDFVAKLRVDSRRLANVTWHESTINMRAIYATTRVLLVPSEWEETWGRVVTEGHACGIPALASAIAGLPESVGPGGVLVTPGSAIESWVAALRSMWDDPAYYEELCRRSREFSDRAEARPVERAERFLSALGPRRSPAQPSAA